MATEGVGPGCTAIRVSDATHIGLPVRLGMRVPGEGAGVSGISLEAGVSKTIASITICRIAESRTGEWRYPSGLELLID